VKGKKVVAIEPPWAVSGSVEKAGAVGRPREEGGGGGGAWLPPLAKKANGHQLTSQVARAAKRRGKGGLRVRHLIKEGLECVKRSETPKA